MPNLALKGAKFIFPRLWKMTLYTRGWVGNTMFWECVSVIRPLVVCVSPSLLALTNITVASSVFVVTSSRAPACKTTTNSVNNNKRLTVQGWQVRDTWKSSTTGNKMFQFDQTFTSNPCFQCPLVHALTRFFSLKHISLPCSKYGVDRSVWLVITKRIRI